VKAGEVALAALPVRRESGYTPSSCMYSSFYLPNIFKQDGGNVYFEHVKSNKTIYSGFRNQDSWRELTNPCYTK